MIDAKRVIATYRGWNALEKPGGVEIIDFDLIPDIRNQQDFDSRKEVLAHLIELRGNCDLRPKKADEQFLKARFQASIYYLRALMGEDIPFSLYIANTMGIRPRLIPKLVIEAQKRKVDDLLKDFGVPHKKSVQQFSEEIRIEQKEAEEEERKAERTHLPQFLHIMGWDELQLSYQVKFVEKQAYWTGWTRTIEDGSFELRFNFHPMHHWHKGDMEFLVLHEIGGHFVQMAHIKEAIRQGRVNPALGLTMVHDPHAFGSEGTANANSYFLPEIKLSPLGVLAREERVLRNYLNNNAHIAVNQGKDPEESAKRILETHPFLTEEKVRMNLKNWVENPELRTYQYSYGIADYIHHLWYKKLSRKEKRAYLRFALSRTATPSQLMNFIAQL